MKIEFFIPFSVRPKQGFEIGVRNGRGVAIGKETVKSNARVLASFAEEHRPAEPLDEPVTVQYRFEFPYRKCDAAAERRGIAIPMDTKPDLGNLEKQADDVLEAAGVLRNDSRIWQRLGSCKVRTGRHGVRVRVMTGADQSAD